MDSPCSELVILEALETTLFPFPLVVMVINFIRLPKNGGEREREREKEKNREKPYLSMA